MRILFLENYHVAEGDVEEHATGDGVDPLICVKVTADHDANGQSDVA